MGATKFTFPQTTGGAVAPIICNTVSLAQIQALITVNSLKCGQLYTITNPFGNGNGYGSVTLQAISNNTLDPSGVWNRSGNCKGVAAITFSTMAPGDSIIQLTVSYTGVNLLSVPVPFNTSQAQTMSDIATEINNNSGVTNFGASATPTGIIINYLIVDNLLNGTTIAISVGGFVVPIFNLPFRDAEDPNVRQQLPCIYDITANQLTQVIFNQNTLINSQNNDNVIFEFPYTIPGIVNNTIKNTLIRQSKIYANNFFIGNSFLNSNIFSNVIIIQGFIVNDSTILNYLFDTIDLNEFRLLNSNIIPINGGLFQGSFNDVVFENVYNDGITYRCSGFVDFDGSAGGGQVGTNVFLQTSPQAFCGFASYRVKLFCNGVAGGLLAELSMGTNTTPTGLINATLVTNFVGVQTLPGSDFGPDTFGNFVIVPTVNDTTAGRIIYEIEGILNV